MWWKCIVSRVFLPLVVGLDAPALAAHLNKLSAASIKASQAAQYDLHNTELHVLLYKGRHVCCCLSVVLRHLWNIYHVQSHHKEKMSWKICLCDSLLSCKPAFNTSDHWRCPGWLVFEQNPAMNMMEKRIKQKRGHTFFLNCPRFLCVFNFKYIRISHDYARKIL